MTLFALHGFLGEPRDFDQVKSFLPEFPWIVPDYTKIPEISPRVPLARWGAEWNRWVVSQTTDKKILLGYSQGGRLALQAFFENQDLFDALILISAQIGIPESSKPARLTSDLQWAERFEKDDFETVLKDWNHQSVFRGSRNEPVRSERSKDRELISRCLSEWSVARQKDFRSELVGLQKPCLFISGSMDEKYCELGREIRELNSRINFQEIKEAGHRVVLDQPEALARAIQDFLDYRG